MILILKTLLLEDEVARFFATSESMDGLKMSFWDLTSSDSKKLIEQQL